VPFSPTEVIELSLLRSGRSQAGGLSEATVACEARQIRSSGEEKPIHQEVQSQTEEKLPLRVVVVIGALSGFAPLSIDMYLPGLPALQRHFASSASAAQLTLTACLLGLALAQVVIGPWSDRVGRLRPMLIGVALYVIASFACAVATSLWLFTALRFVQGAAGAAGIVVSRAMVRDLRSGAQAVRLFSMLQIVNGFFPALAPVIGAQLLRLGSWRLIFVVLGIAGTVLLAAAVLVLGETHPVAARSTGGLKMTLTSFAVLLRDGPFMGYALVSGFVIGAMFAYISGASFVLENIFHLSPQVFSAVFAANAAGIVVASQISSTAVARTGAARLLSWGVLCSVLGAVGLVVSVTAHLGLGGVLVSLFVLVSAVGVVMPSATALAMAEYPHIAGSASGLLGVLQFLIGAACAPLVGAFGTKTALPMAVVIASLAFLALLTRSGVALSVRTTSATPAA
jgi:DHA1 family bicyclomycin/chloramphenicol resistance-like MFS transporter